MKCVITIDGPAGAGKSTVARRLAERLGWRFLDTGAMYRAVTLAGLRARVEFTSEPALAALVESLVVKFPGERVVLGDEDITEAIRSVEVTEASKYVADSKSVRQCLTVWQRAVAGECNVVTEGRDQGTLVFPDAFRKFFLTASELERAHRRLKDYQSRGQEATLDSVLNDQRARDARDRARTIAPMKAAPDAVVIDSTGLSIDEVVDRMIFDMEAHRVHPRPQVASPQGAHS